MKNIEYVINLIFKRPYKLFINISHVVIISVILLSGIDIIGQGITTYLHYSICSNYENVYRLYEQEKEYVDEDYCDKQYKFYNYLENESDIKYYLQVDSNALIENAKINDDIKYSKQDEIIDGEIYSSIKSLYIDNNYIKYCDLELQEGRNLKETDFKDGDIVPILIGNNYDKYNVGDEIHFYDYLSKQQKKFKVVGKLKKNNYRISQISFINLDNYIIIPFQNITNRIKDKSVYGFMRYSIMVISEDYVLDAEKINKKAQQLNSNYYSLSSVQKEIDYVTREIKYGSIEKILIILCCIIVLVISNALIIYSKIAKENLEYSLTDISKKDIFFRIELELAIIYILGILISIYYLYLYSIELINIKNISILLAILGSVFIIVSIGLYLKLISKNKL